MLNQSLGGLCIVVIKPIQVGTVLNLSNFGALAGGPQTQVLVKHARLQRGGFALGCQYLLSAFRNGVTSHDASTGSFQRQN